MITVYTENEEIEGAEVKQIQYKPMILGTGQEYLIMYDIGEKLDLFKLHREGKNLEFTYVDKIKGIEVEPERRLNLCYSNFQNRDKSDED